jgi:hypothetical protein
MKILIREKQLKLLKIHLLEAVGVPENITKIASKLYNEIIKRIPSSGDFGELDGLRMGIPILDNISDMPISVISVTLDLIEYDNMELVGFSFGQTSKVTDDLRSENIPYDGNITLKIRLATPKEVNGGEIIEFFNSNKIEVGSALSHELKHAYDNFKKPISALSKMSEYKTYAGFRFGIDPVDEFIHNLYFIHLFENLVRPSEIFSRMEHLGITEEGFYDFITNDSVYKNLKKLREFTLNDFKDTLKSYVSYIKIFFDKIDMEYDIETSDEEIVDMMLELIFINLTNRKLENLVGAITTHPLEDLFGFSGEKSEFLRSYQTKLLKYQNNVQGFFENEIKTFNFVANKTIRNLSKLFSMVNKKETTNESIHNFKLWQRAEGIKPKIHTKLKKIR